MFTRKSLQKLRGKLTSKRRTRGLSLEPLERRALLSVSPTMIDIDLGTASAPSDFVQVGDLTYFTATSEEYGRELWVTDGTEEGTVQVKDIYEGTYTNDYGTYANSSDPTELIEYNGELFFVANDGENGAELWKTDGTEDGTVMVADIADGEGYQYPYGTGPYQSAPSNLTISDGTLFFTAWDPDSGIELWKTDGTESGTVMVKDIFEGTYTDSYGTYANSSNPKYLVDLDGTLFFSAYTNEDGRELWSSDGTESGTVMVKDIFEGTYYYYGTYGTYGPYANSSNPSNFTVMDGELYFVAQEETYGAELWKTDGTESGTEIVADIAPGTVSSMDQYSAMLVIDGTLYFSADDGTHGDELWISDGTADGTELVKDINEGSGGNLSYYAGFIEFDDMLFFSADDGVNGRELWRSDGTEEGTVLVKDFYTGTDSYGYGYDSYPFYMEVVDGQLFISAKGSSTGRELWMSDGTEEGTVLVVDTIEGSTGVYPNSLNVANGYLLFSGIADDGRELWSLDLSTVGLATAELTIWVNSEAVTLPTNIGVEESGDTAEAYTTNSTGTIALTSPGETTLGEFFETWRTDAGLAGENEDATLSSTELLGYTADLEYTVQMFVNGEICTDFDDYVIQDDDEIILIYGSNPVVSLITNYGAIVIELFEEDTPGTVENFLDYVNDGDYLNSIFHRSVEDFVIQGGGYTTTTSEFSDTSQFTEITSNGTIENEPGLSNLRGTVAMAKISGDADSATSQFFVNLSDDNVFLDEEDNDAFTVFGQVLDMTSVDTIADLPIDTTNDSPFNTLPMSSDDYVVVVESIVGLGEITGFKFLDVDADGVYDSEVDSLMSGVTVFLDTDGDGVLDDDEVSTVTDENGEYMFQVESGTYTVWAEITDSSVCTLPTSTGGSYSVTVEIGRETASINFAEAALSAPESVSLVAAYDTGTADDDGLTNLNNSSSSTVLQFLVEGVTDGAEVSVYADGVLIGTATASGDSVTVTTDGETTIADGTCSITATQGLSGNASEASTAIEVTIDTVAPADLDEDPTDVAEINVLYEFDADSGDEGEEGLLYSLSDAPDGMTIDADTGEISWTPTSDQAVPQDFEILITDAAGNVTSHAVAMTVLGDIPAYPDEYTVNEDETLTVDADSGVLANDGDDESGDLSATLVSDVSNGTLTFSSDGSFTYVPDADFYGTDTFTYMASDSEDDSNVARVTITVVNVNDVPEPEADSYTTEEDVTLTIDADSGVLANDVDSDGDTLTASLASQASNGTVTLNSDGSFTYVPDDEFSGTDSFTYTVSDGTVESDAVTVSLTIEEVLDPPTAVADSYQVSEDSTLTITAASGLLANDTDPDSDSLTVSVSDSPANGTLTLNSNGSFTYVPDADFYGTDTFTYVASDGTNSTSETTVTITVNSVPDAPTAVDDSSTTYNGGTTTTVDVLDNDTSDPDDDDTLTIVSVTQGSSGGTVTIDGDAIVYTAPYGFTGTDTFTYTIEDSDGLQDTATVTMTVNANSGSSSSGSSSGSDTSTGSNSLAGYAYIDRDGDGVRDDDECGVPGVQITLTGVDESGNSLEYIVLTHTDGSYLFEGLPDGTYELTERQPTALGDGVDTTSISDAETGDDQFTNIVLSGGDSYTENNFGESGLHAKYVSVSMFLASASSPAECLLEAIIRAEELAGYSELAESIRNGVTDAETDNEAPVAVNDAYSATSGSTLTVTSSSGVLANDGDDDGDSLTAVLVSSATNGTVALSSDGSFTYTPDSGFSGTDTFTYKASDGTAYSNTATVTITVGDANSAPAAVSDAYSVNAGSTLTVTASSGVLDNDTDADGDSLTASLVSSPSNGTLTFDTDGSFTYTPTSGFSGTDSFTYKASDGSLTSGTTTVTITVVAVNNVPVGEDDAYSLDEDDTLTVDADSGVLANDTDEDNDDLTATVVTSPSNGTLTLNSDGSFTYVPDADFNGTDSFTYVADDGTDESDDVTVTLTVSAVNDAPVGEADSYTVAADGSLTVDADEGVLVNDEDADGDTLSATVYSDPENGTLTLNSDGSFTYTPNAGYTGSDSFTYLASDGTDTSEATTVSIVVNTPPTAADDSYEMDEDTALAVDAVMGLLANDSDANSDTLTVAVVDSPEHGTLTLNEDGSFTYTPDDDYYGTDSFTYKADDGLNESEAATVTITVADVDDPSTITLPEAYSDPDNPAQVTLGDTVSFTVTVSDVDDDDYVFQLDLESSGIDSGDTQPTIDASTGEFEWTPSAAGEYEIRVIVVNGDGEANQETFILDVLSS